jgi:hypothetical protein
MPMRRHTSTPGTPPSACRKAATICSFVNDFFIDFTPLETDGQTNFNKSSFWGADQGLVCPLFLDM